MFLVENGIHYDQSSSKKSTESEDKPSESDHVFLAFARVFSGTVRKGQQLYVLGPKHDPSKALEEVHSTLQFYLFCLITSPTDNFALLSVSWQVVRREFPVAVVGGGGGASSYPHALSIKEQHLADGFVMTLYSVLYLSCVMFVCCQWCWGLFPSLIGLARHNLNEITLRTALNPNQTKKQH